MIHKAAAAAILAALLAVAENPIPKLLEEAWQRSQSNETKTLARSVENLIRSGEHEQAARSARNAAAIERAFGSGESAALWERISRDLQAEAEFTQVLRSMPLDIQEAMTDFRSMALPMARVAPVAVEAQPFIRAFLNSAKSPEAYMNRMSVQQKLEYIEWSMTDRNKRLFMAGSGKDEPLARRIKEEFKKHGYSTFFYKLCVGPTGELCESEIVGSYFKDSGKAILIHTPAAGSSPFVQPEMEAALAISEGRTVFLMISPAQYRDAEALYASGKRVGRQRLQAAAIVLDNNATQQPNKQ